MKVLIFLAASLAIGFSDDTLETAPYKVLKVMDGYEVRETAPLRWVATDALAMDVHDSQESTDAFYRLFNYISGENAAGVKIDMTAPVTRFIKPGAGPNCESEFTTGFYIPEMYQNVPIEPTGEGVYIEDRPGFKYVASTFPGYASNDDYIKATVELYQLATDNGEDIIADTYYHAGYDGPYTIINRRNEVWFKLRE